MRIIDEVSGRNLQLGFWIASMKLVNKECIA